MKKFSFALLLCFFLLTSCSSTSSKPKLAGSYYSDLLPNADGGNVEQVQLSFTQETDAFFHLSSTYQRTFQFKQDENYDSVYYLEMNGKTTMITLMEDNSFYLPYENDEFTGSAILMKYNGSSIQTSPLYEPSK